MNRLDQFLRVAARSMRVMPTALRDDELRELRGHIEQRVEDYQSAGMSDDAAQVRALEGLGSPRALGAKLCDAWEGIAFSWWRLLAAVGGVTAFLLFGTIVIVLSLAIIPSNAEIALLPEIVPALCGFYLALPLLCGLIFSHWLGRRGCLVATIYFLTLALGNFTMKFPASSSLGFEAPPTFFLEIFNASWFAYFWVVWAFIGAWVGQRWRLQKRYQLATFGANISAPKRVLWIPLNLGWWRNVLLLTGLAGALYAARVWLQFHPKTPTATLANYLRLAAPQGFEAPEILELRELPPANVAERAGTQRRVHFRAAARAKPYFAASQIKYLSGQIESRKRNKSDIIPSTEAALKRVENNRQIIEGTVTLVKTNEGWRADENSFDFIVLWEWFYDR